MNRILALILSIAMLISGMAIPAMAEGADADVIIVGAGGAGLSAALEAVANGAEKVIKDAEVIRVLEILEEATEVAKSHAR